MIEIQAEPEHIAISKSKGIQIDWSDGHNTGIYSFDHLRKICACVECKAK